MSPARVFAMTEDMSGQPVESKLSANGADFPEVGSTRHFILYYEKVLGNNGLAIASTIKTRCEADFATLKGWFRGATPANLPFKVYVAKDVKGAMHYGCADTEIYVGAGGGTSAQDLVYPLLLAAEVAEVLEATIGVKWNCGYSNGEGLSRVLPDDIYDGKVHATDLATAPKWLYEKAPDGTLRRNWVDKVDTSDTDKFSVGCSVLFLNWLRFKLGHSWEGIIASGEETLGKTYKKLTGKSDGWESFKHLVDTTFPTGSPTVKTDNPFRPSGPSVASTAAAPST